MSQKVTKKAEDAIILALAAGATVREAAEQAKVCERTIFRRLDERTFVGRINEARGRMFAKAIGQLATSATKAATRLEELLQSESDSVCLSAARAVLELGVRLRESVELEERIAALELRHDEKPIIGAD